MNVKNKLAKRQLGIYYTPESAAQFLAEWAIREATDKVLEPSFGGCALLTAAVLRLRELGATDLTDRLFGFDLDPAAFISLQNLLDADDLRQFRKQDFLKSRPQTPNGHADAVIANPPFVSYRRMTERQRTSVESWRRTYTWPFSLGSGLWAYFLIHSLAYLKPGGRMAFILPSSIIQADYAKPIRDYLTDNFREIHLINVNEQLFVQEGAVERTVILLADGYLSQGAGSHKLLTVSSLSDLKDAIANNALLPTKTLSIDDVKCFLTAPENAIELRSFSKISIGEVIGDSKFFVRSSEEWEKTMIPVEACKPIIKGAVTLRGLIVRKDDTESMPRLLHADSTELPSPVATYLSTYPIAKRQKNSTFRKRKEWHLASYSTDAVGFIPNVSSIAPRFVLNAANLTCTNSVYKLHLKANEAVSGAALAIAFQTTLTQLSAEVLSRTLGSGGLKMEPSDLGKLILPKSAFALDIDTACSVLKQMDEMYRRKDYEKITALADKILLIDPDIISKKQYRSLCFELRTKRQHRKNTSAV